MIAQSENVLEEDVNQEDMLKPEGPSLEKESSPASENMEHTAQEKIVTTLLDQHKEEVKAIREELARNTDQLIRLQAEFENYRKRVLKERSEWKRLALADFLLELLGIIDNLERAVRSVPETDKKSSLYQGIEMILQQMMKVLTQYSLKKIPSLGIQFDPSLHEAISSEYSEKEENQIIEEISSGYFFEDKLLRAAKVKVSLGPAKKSE